MFRGFYCLMVSGKPIDDEVSTQLYVAACRMFDGGNNRKKLSGANYEGVLTTEFEYVSMGSIGGTRFRAEIETDSGTTRVDFVVHDRDVEAMLEEGGWSTFMVPVEDLRSRPSPSAYVN